MRPHPVRVGAPRDIVPPPASGVDTPPALLQRSDDNFVEATVEGLRTAAGRETVAGSLAITRTPSGIASLPSPMVSTSTAPLLAA